MEQRIGIIGAGAKHLDAIAKLLPH